MFQVEVQLQDTDHLNKVIKSLRKVDSVYEVRRKKNQEVFMKLVVQRVKNADVKVWEKEVQMLQKMLQI